MTWDELREYLVRENDRCNAGEQARIKSIQTSPELPSERRARRLAGEYEARCAIDQACRHFAATESWPAMDAAATLYAHDRWIWAMWFSEWLDQASPLEENMSRQEWLQWLLVESWHELGSWRWRASQS